MSLLLLIRQNTLLIKRQLQQFSTRIQNFFEQNMQQKPQDASLFYQKYTIQFEIGRGASGICYKIKRNQDGRTFALKKISSNSIKKNNLKGAYNQVTILSSLKHSSIIKYYQSFVSDHDLYIVMQYASKGDLHTILKKRKIKQQFYEQLEVWKIVQQLLKGIDYLHNKSIIHRDIKTLNVFVEQGNQVFIGDLGVSKIVKSDLGLYSRVGTPLYLAPEIIKYEKYDFKADIWGLGCVTYLLSALVHPFQGKNIISLGQNIVNSAPKPINRYSDKLNQIIFQMLQKNHTKRLDSKSLLQKYFSSGFTVQKTLTVQKKPSKTFVASSDFQIEQIQEDSKQLQERKMVQDYRRKLNIKRDPKFSVQRRSVASQMSTQNRISYKGSKISLQNKIPQYSIGNFVNEPVLVSKYSGKNIQNAYYSNKNLDTTLVLQNKMSRQKQQIGNQELTKHQQKQPTVSLKKLFQSQHEQSQLINYKRDKKLKKGYQLAQQAVQDKKQQNMKFNNYVSSSSHCFKPCLYNNQIPVDNQILNKKQFKKIPTEINNQRDYNQFQRRYTKQNTMVEMPNRNKFVRSSQQLRSPSEAGSEALFLDVAKIANQCNFTKKIVEQSKSFGRYRQRPKSSIGKKPIFIDSDAIKPRRKDATSAAGISSIIQMRILKKPQMVML